jgi:hypothetical protein
VVKSEPTTTFEDASFTYATDTEGYDEPVFKPKIMLDRVSDPVVKKVADIFLGMDNNYKARARTILRNAGEVVHQDKKKGMSQYNDFTVLEAMVNQGFKFSDSTTASDIMNFITALNDKNTLKA